MTVTLSVNFPSAGSTLTIDNKATKYNSPDLVFSNDPNKKILFYDPVSRRMYEKVVITARVASLFGFNSIVFNNSGHVFLHSVVQEGDPGQSGRSIDVLQGGEMTIKFHACCCKAHVPGWLGGGCVAGQTSCGHSYKHINRVSATNGETVWCSKAVFGDPADGCLKSCDIEIPKNQSKYNIYTLDPQPSNFSTVYSDEHFMYWGTWMMR